MRQCLLLPLLGLAFSVPVLAADDDPYAALPEAVARVESETGGKVLQVRAIQRGDREVYRMKVLTPEGRVKIVHDDPKRARIRREDPPDVPERDVPRDERRR